MSKVFCCYCGKFLLFKSEITTEHIVPVSKNGNHSLANRKKCCDKCNKWRGNKSLQDFKIEVNNHLINNKPKLGYHKLDLKIMLENIDYWIDYVDIREDELTYKK